MIVLPVVVDIWFIPVWLHDVQVVISVFLSLLILVLYLKYVAGFRKHSMGYGGGTISFSAWVECSVGVCEIHFDL